MKGIISSITHPRLTVIVVRVANRGVVYHELVFRGFESMLIRIALKDGSRCACVKSNASQNGLGQSSEVHSGLEVTLYTLYT